MKPLGYTALNLALGDLSKRAGIRHIYPHMLRHSRLTELAKSGLGEYQLKSFAGWTLDRRMAARYIHLAGRDHVSAVLSPEAVERGLELCNAYRHAVGLPPLGRSFRELV